MSVKKLTMVILSQYPTSCCGLFTWAEACYSIVESFYTNLQLLDGISLLALRLATARTPIRVQEAFKKVEALFTNTSNGRKSLANQIVGFQPKRTYDVKNESPCKRNHRSFLIHTNNHAWHGQNQYQTWMSSLFPLRCLYQKDYH